MPRKPALAALVDDYLAKIEARNKASVLRQQLQHQGLCDCKLQPTMDAFIAAHNAVNAAFRALRDSRLTPAQLKGRNDPFRSFKKGS